MMWSTIERATTQGTSFIVILLLARLLGPHSYGLVAWAATIALLGQMLLGETFSQALIQERNLAPEHTSSLFWLLFAAGIGATAALFGFAYGISALFAEKSLAPILRALSPLLFLTALQAVPNALFRRDLNFKSIATASTFGTMTGGILGVALAFSGFGIWSLVANLLAQNLIVTVTVWRKTSFRPQLNFSFPHLRQLWAYGQYTFLHRIVAFAANQGPRLLIGYIFGPAALGMFGLGLRVVEILYQLLTLPAVNVLTPLIAGIREDRRRLETVILSATQLAAMASVPIYVVLAVTAPVAVPLFFGVRWVTGIPVVQLLCIYGVVGSCGLIWQAIISGLGRPDIMLKATTVAAIVNVSIIALTARWGLAAAAGAFVARGYLTLPFMPLVIARLTGLSAAKQYKVYAPVAAAALTMALSMQVSTASLATLPALAILGVCCLVGAVGYLLTLYLTAKPAMRVGLSFLSHLRPGGTVA